MKASELRIGNLIYNGIDSVMSVNKHTIFLFDESGSELGEFKPIKLTPEWLEERTNFSAEEYSNTYYLYGVALYILHDEIYYTQAGIEIRIRYVHKLQNLFFALTDMELTIKELVHD